MCFVESSISIQSSEQAHDDDDDDELGTTPGNNDTGQQAGEIRPSIATMG